MELQSIHEVKERTKLEKMLGKEYVAELGNLTKAELKQKLYDLAKHEQELITTQNKDEELMRTKEKVKELAAPYREQRKMVKVRARLVALMIEEKE